MYEILASGCHHAIAVTCTPVGHGHILSPTTVLCDSCEDHQIFQELVSLSDAAYQESRLVLPEDPENEREMAALNYATRVAKRRAARAKKYLANDMDYRIHHEMATGFVTRDGAGNKIVPYAAVQMRCSHGRSIKFTQAQPHRPEGEYRQQGAYHRLSPGYTPGTYADTSGAGFQDTANTIRIARADLEAYEARGEVPPGTKAASDARRAAADARRASERAARASEREAAEARRASEQVAAEVEESLETATAAVDAQTAEPETAEAERSQLAAEVEESLERATAAVDARRAERETADTARSQRADAAEERRRAAEPAGSEAGLGIFPTPDEIEEGWVSI